MANYMADSTLNKAADHITASTLGVRLHSGAPGNNGTDNRIGSVSQDVAASGWSDADAGESSNKAAIDFGVLSNSSNNTVGAYSLWEGNTFRGWADLTSAVTVAANERFSLRAGTVKVKFARPA